MIRTVSFLEGIIRYNIRAMTLREEGEEEEAYKKHCWQFFRRGRGGGRCRKRGISLLLLSFARMFLGSRNFQLDSRSFFMSADSKYVQKSFLYCSI